MPTSSADQVIAARARSALVAADPPALTIAGRRKRDVILALAWAGALGLGVFASGRHELLAAIHQTPAGLAFWLLFLGYCLSTPISEWVLYHHLWRIPLSGVVALLRKYVSNEMLFGYLGEADFYAWARREGQLTASPFGVIKDVAILSAACGSAVTLLVLPFGIGLVLALHPHIPPLALDSSFAIFLVSLIVPILFRNRIFCLDRSALLFIAKVHLARIVAGMAIYAMLWHMMLPSVSIGWCALISCARQMVSRLPLVQNKEVLFAAISVLFIGRQAEVTALLLAFAGCAVAIQIALGALVLAWGIARS